MEKYLRANQVAELEKKLEEIEAWAGGLLHKCSEARHLLQNMTASTPAPAKKQGGLTAAQLAEISAKQRIRMLKRRKGD
jgi:hypothetical protein